MKPLTEPTNLKFVIPKIIHIDNLEPEMSH